MEPKERGKAGNAAARQKNPNHQREAGRAAIRAVADRYANGDIGDWMAYLRSRQTTYQLDQAADQQNAQQLANGLSVAVTELPVTTWPEDDPTFWREMVSSQSRGRSRVG